MSDSPPIILQVLPRLESGGVERGTIEITSAIRHAGWKALVASNGGSMVPHVTHAGGEHITLPLKTKNPLKIYANAHRLARVIRERGVSLIHARSRGPAWSAYLAAKWTGIPLVTTFHGVYSFEGKVKWRYNQIMTRGVRVIAVSNYIREHLIEAYHVAAEKIVTIHRGVDFSVFGGKHVIPERLATLTKQWRLPDEHVPVIFCPGRISPTKGQHVLIDALALMKDEPFLCIIAGSDEGHEEYRHQLQEQIVAHGLEGKMRMADATKFMNEAYQLSHLVVVPSIRPESFGRVAIEAQAMGLAVVATDQGGSRETIVQNETGYLVPPENAQAMMVSIKYALNRDPATVRAMADFARRHVRDHFSAELMKEKTLQVYADVLHAHALAQHAAAAPTPAEAPAEEMAE